MKNAFLFPGQGELATAETRGLWRDDEAARAVWHEAAEILDEPVATWLDTGVAGDTRRAQLLSVVGSLATYEAYRRTVRLAPGLLLGHSVGEIAALSVSARLDLATTLHIVDARGRAMQEAVSSGPPMAMAAVVDPPSDLGDRLAAHPDVYIANINSRRQVVISGSADGIDVAVRELGLQAIRLDVAGAFHTPYMSEAAATFAKELRALEPLVELGPAVVSNRTARLYETTDVVHELAEQIVSPVLWSESVAFAFARGAQHALDFSSTGMLSRMSDIGEMKHFHVRSSETLAATAHDLRHHIKVQGGYDLPARALGAIVTSRNGNPDPAQYREVVIPAYQELRALVGKDHIDTDHVIAVVGTVLDAKAVPQARRSRVLAELRWHAYDAAAS